MMSWTAPAQRSPGAPASARGAGSSSTSTGRGHLGRWNGAGRLSVASTHPRRTRLVTRAAPPSTPPPAPAPTTPAARLAEQLVQSTGSAASSSQESLAELRHIHSHMSKLSDAQAEQARAIAELAARVEKVEAALSRESRTQRLQAAVLLPEPQVRDLLKRLGLTYSDQLPSIVLELLAFLLRGERGGRLSQNQGKYANELVTAVHVLAGIKAEVKQEEDGRKTIYIP